MKALCYNGPGKIEVREKPKPEVKEPHDAIVKLLRTTIWYVLGPCSNIAARRGPSPT